MALQDITPDTNTIHENEDGLEVNNSTVHTVKNRVFHDGRAYTLWQRKEAKNGNMSYRYECEARGCDGTLNWSTT